MCVCVSVCQCLGVSIRLKVALQRPFVSLVLETCIFLGLRYYRGFPRYYRRSCARHYRTQHNSNSLLPLEERYYRPRCGTSARAVLPRRHAVLPRSREHVGVKSGQGEFQLPHTHSLAPSLCSSLFSNRCRGRTSPDLHLRPLSSHFNRWD